MLRRNKFEDDLITRREYAILELVAAGLKNLDIGRAMGMTENVVKNYMRGLYDKLGFWNRVEAALWWQSRNLPKVPRWRIPRHEWQRKEVKHQPAVKDARLAKRTRLDLRQDGTEYHYPRSYEPDRETAVQAGPIRVCRCCGSPLDDEGRSVLAGYRRDEQQVRTSEKDQRGAGDNSDFAGGEYDRVSSLAEARAARQKTLGGLPLPS